MLKFQSSIVQCSVVQSECSSARTVVVNLKCSDFKVQCSMLKVCFNVLLYNLSAHQRAHPLLLQFPASPPLQTGFVNCFRPFHLTTTSKPALSSFGVKVSLLDGAIWKHFDFYCSGGKQTLGYQNKNRNLYLRVPTWTLWGHYIKVNYCCFSI